MLRWILHDALNLEFKAEVSAFQTYQNKTIFPESFVVVMWKEISCKKLHTVTGSFGPFSYPARVKKLHLRQSGHRKCQNEIKSSPLVTTVHSTQWFSECTQWVSDWSDDKFHFTKPNNFVLWYGIQCNDLSMLTFLLLMHCSQLALHVLRACSDLTTLRHTVRGAPLPRPTPQGQFSETRLQGWFPAGGWGNKEI